MLLLSMNHVLMCTSLSLTFIAVKKGEHASINYRYRYD